MKKYVAILLCGIMLVPGCSSWSKLATGTAVGGGAGAALGAAVGALIGKDGKSAAIGAAIGTAVGAGTGAVIGKKMDKKAAELAALENAKIEQITDVNGLPAIKVTFDSGILFPTNGTTLSAASKTQLTTFASKMADLPDTDFAIIGHTDNTGSAAVNERISLQRADAVFRYLKGCGIADTRMTAQGASFNLPVADNSTEAGRAQNRRVEVYVYANEAMVKAAEQGKL